MAHKKKPKDELADNVNEMATWLLEAARDEENTVTDLRVEISRIAENLFSLASKIRERHLKATQTNDQRKTSGN